MKIFYLTTAQDSESFATNLSKWSVSPNLSNQNFLLVRVVITHCGKTIYDSKGSLVREFIVFNKDGKEVRSGECLPGLYFCMLKT